MRNTNTKQLSSWVSPKALEAMKYCAYRLDMSLSNFVREAVEEKCRRTRKELES